MNLFAYGTLMWPEVLEAVVGRRLQGEPAVLEGHVRLRVAGENYPVAVPSPGGSVEGVLYRSLTDGDFLRLDRFEGEEYDRAEVGIGNEQALVYVLSPEHRHIAEHNPWNPVQMKSRHLESFCREGKARRDLGS